MLFLTEPDDDAVMLPGLDKPVQIRRSPRARRFALKVDEAKRAAILTLPASASIDEALSFANRHIAWLQKRLTAIPSSVPFADGAIFPLRGLDHQIRTVGRKRSCGVVWTDADDVEQPLVCVAGDARHASRRLVDWLKSEARKDVTARVNWHAGQLELNPKKITVRDQTTRWGSCSSSGSLSFSWRLILAPHFVLDYVAAHEVAHLEEMNHGPAFWQLVYKTMPRTDEARLWLKRHGTALHRYGVE